MYYDKFNEMGAKVVNEPLPKFAGRPFRLDVRKDTFVVQGVEPEVVDLRKDLKHLLLLIRVDGQKMKFLCGHDEREWFAASVPSNAKNVTHAMDLLKPSTVHEAQKRVGVKSKNRRKRRNKGSVRQGEWFFVPVDLRVDKNLILRKEKLQRNPRSKPHVADEAYREGGRTIYLLRGRRYTAQQFTKLTPKERKEARYAEVRTENAQVYVRGKVRHPDHKTIYLPGWHRVEMNTEGQAPSGFYLSFID